MKAITEATNVYLDYRLARHISDMQVTWHLGKEGPHRMSDTALLENLKHGIYGT